MPIVTIPITREGTTPFPSRSGGGRPIRPRAPCASGAPCPAQWSPYPNSPAAFAAA